ncbi:N-acetylglucosamine-specific PTS transporter subunit IIBC [Steroidobacter sp.]|uniref:N-acetylglucosamine-specific PTS transporter subunit IIBC n=1 Tax=Steroidobacter sp. TaxID=1978227 RepID=UPI0025E500B8|nr:N-acetylglucosamine-specific PTS transporter subunit IIBC [Steroidobacter sp.]
MITGLQSVGRALMLPIAVLPVAALLLRLGQPDLLDIPAIAAAGDAIFSNLGLLFAIGVAVGLAKENHGAAGLASVVGYLVTTKGAEVLIAVPPEVTAQLAGQARDFAMAAFRERELAKLSVPAGLLNGLIAGWLYNKYSDIRLPAYLAFFGGRRFVPIASGTAGIVLALAFGFGWPVLESGMDTASEAVLASDSFGLFAYGVLNRVLIVTGLHHILNNMAWFLLGDYQGVTGDLKRFFAGDPTAGAFMSGFFPVMMFGLPAACLAMYRTAAPERRKAVGGMLFSMALTSFLTGVTEPIEFTFMFLAPVLYGIHAALTGAAMAIMDLLNIRIGFGFSAGLFDYVLNFSQATQPLWLVPIGLIYFALYYGLFRFFIVRFNLATPGREIEDVNSTTGEATTQDDSVQGWIRALGGAGNLVAVDACTTRLRLSIADQKLVNEAALKSLGARGLVRPSQQTLQVVVGPIADQLASSIRHGLKLPASLGTQAATPTTTNVGAPSAVSAPNLLQLLGGADNIRELRAAASRLCITLRDGAAVSDDLNKLAGVRGVARPAANSLHIIVGPAAPRLLTELSQLR